jgi:soluble lytic murein transglycosylase-like protein
VGLRRTRPATGRGGRKAGLWALGLALVAAPATAQVIEVRPDAGAVTYAGPVVWSAEGVRALQPIAAPTSAGSVGEAIRIAAARHAVSPALVEAVAWQESRLNQRAVSPKGARGVMQLMPGTARELGVDAHDLAGNVEGGAAYLARMMNEFDGDLVKALAAYNAGPGAVKRHGGVPPYAETQGYVAAVLARLAASTGTP